MAARPSTKPGAHSSTSFFSNIVGSRHGQTNSKDILKRNDDWTTTIGGDLDLLKELPLYPITSDTPLRQTLDTFSLKRYQEYATKEVPDIAEDDIALEMYARKHTIEGIFTEKMDISMLSDQVRISYNLEGVDMLRLKVHDQISISSRIRTTLSVILTTLATEVVDATSSLLAKRLDVPLDAQMSTALSQRKIELFWHIAVSQDGTYLPTMLDMS